MNKKELIRAIKYTSIACSTGVLEFLLVALFNVHKLNNMLSYFIALVISVTVNFIINRKYTFKSASNVTKASFLLFLFYVVFTPLSLLFVGYLGDGIVLSEKFLVINHLGWHWIIGFIINVTINIATEYLYQKYIVFKGSLDTNSLAKKDNNKS